MSLNVLTLLWRATRTSSVIGFAAGYLLRCLHVQCPSGFGPGGPNPRGVQIRCDKDKVFKMLRVGQSVFC